MRIENSIKNTLFAISGQLLTILITFLNRTVFIYILGINYLGIHGLFTNILTMLSLAELGVGSAITYHMYKPLAEGNKKKISALMGFYATAYRVIGISVAIIGIGITPFLGYIVKDNNVPDITMIYALFLTNSVLSYFFSYKRSLIYADQKDYINTINMNLFGLLQSILQIIFLLITRNYLLYLILQIIITVTSNIVISKKVNSLYPFLKSKEKEYLNKSDKRTIFKHIGAMMSHKFGGVVVTGTDNILLSMFIGVSWVGLYSNYLMVITTVNSFITLFFKSLTASIGNLNATEEVEKSESIFYKVFFVNFWGYGFCSISLWVLLNPFIKIWIGPQFIINEKILSFIVLNFFISGMRNTVIAYNTTLGLFWNDRFKPWFEAIINIIASVILLNKFGAIGVFIGTLISTLTTSFWVDPYILYKHAFKKSIKGYFYKYGQYFLVTLIGGLVTVIMCGFLDSDSLLVFAIKCLVCLLIPNIVFITFFRKTTEFFYLLNLLKNLCGKFYRKNKTQSNI